MAVAGRATGRRRIHARRACRGKTACRIGTGPQRTGFLRSLLCARMVEAKKSLCPVLGHRQEKQAGEGEFEGKALSHRQQRCDRMAAQAVPVATQEATGIDSRDATGWRPQAVPVSEKDASRDHRQRGGALKVSAVGDTGPTDIAGRMRGSLSSSKAGCPGRYALRGRPARWAKPMRAWRR